MVSFACYLNDRGFILNLLREIGKNRGFLIAKEGLEPLFF